MKKFLISLGIIITIPVFVAILGCDNIKANAYKCPQCGSHNIKDVNRKSNKITRKCNKCGHKFYVYESFY